MHKLTKKYHSLLLGFCLLFNPLPQTDAQSLEEQTVLAAMALNIVRFTTWLQAQDEWIYYHKTLI